MLFSSNIFIFIYLPIVYLLYRYTLKFDNTKTTISLLVVASLVFYAWFHPPYLLFLGVSILVNFCFALLQVRYKNTAIAGLILFAIVLLNLVFIGYFKYAFFFESSVNALFNTSSGIFEKLVLPLGISFFTFQQIAYQVDVSRNGTAETRLLDYTVFVSFFPQLIAGPIVHHKEMLQQFKQPRKGTELLLVIGLTIFAIGLFKKTILADGVANYANPLFQMAAQGTPLTFIEAWLASLSYTIQLYFDFSGYSDMAIGLACMFGIYLPLNFNSPYKSRNIIDFWRRWHMTLSRFLKQYLYIPLGGSRKGTHRTYVNLMIVMLLGGLWHGAGWTFVAWGGLHGCYLLANHYWQRTLAAKMSNAKGLLPWLSGKLPQALKHFFSILLTFVLVVVAWVYFRADALQTANSIVKGMIGLNGFTLPEEYKLTLGASSFLVNVVGIEFDTMLSFNKGLPFIHDFRLFVSGGEAFSEPVGPITALISLMIPLAIIFLMPNTQRFMGEYSPTLDHSEESQNDHVIFSKLTWRLSAVWGIAISILFAYACFGHSSTAQFLYFNF